MKIRESGMPDEDVWKGFFEPDQILKKLGLNNKVVDAADFGCGYGTFTISAANNNRKGLRYRHRARNDRSHRAKDKSGGFKQC
ncbi:hypothetical protein J7W08_03930 [Methanococcoides orientis]|nr:hypothetical protein [Methanococcoides orientis]UGV41455.1 hypothetical protein J7W08_03930 [Methanococcoides orientis]